MVCITQPPAIIELAQVPCVFVSGLFAQTTEETAQVMGWIDLPALDGKEARRVVVHFAVERSVLLEFHQQLSLNFRKPKHQATA